MKFDRRITPCAAVLVVSLLASPTWASTTIKVVEAGEGGQPMSLTLEPATVKAGKATFTVHNDAVSEEHEMIVVKLKSADEKIPMMEGKDRVDEDKLSSLGEVEDLKAGADGKLTVDLKAGTYLVFCNIKGHYSSGMQSKMVVTP